MMPPRFSVELTGHFADEQVIVRWRVESGRRLDSMIETLIDKDWSSREQIARATQRLLFNGPLCRLIDWRATATTLHLTLGPTDYRTFLGTHIAYLTTLQARHPHDWPAYLANPLAVCSTLVSADGWLLVMRRSQRVAEYPGAYHVVGGHPTPAHDNGLGAISPTLALLEEIAEETSLTPAELSDLTCRGLIRNQATHKPELVYSARLTLPRAAVDARLAQRAHPSEDAGWLWLNDDAAAIYAFLNRHPDQIAPAGAACLTVYAQTAGR